MGRTFRRVYPRCDIATAQQRINYILVSKGYHITPYRTGEMVWKKGTGLMTAMHYIKVDYSNSQCLAHLRSSKSYAF